MYLLSFPLGLRPFFCHDCCLLIANSLSLWWELPSAQRNCFDQAHPSPRAACIWWGYYRNTKCQLPCLHWTASVGHLIKSAEDFVAIPSKLSFCFSPILLLSLLYMCCWCPINSLPTNHLQFLSWEANLKLLMPGLIKKDDSKLNFCCLINLPTRQQYGAWWFISL